MSESGFPQYNPREVDIREVSKNQGHRMVFDAYEKLGPDDTLILINDHEPQDLRDEFDRELDGSFSWETLSAKDDEYRVRIIKRATTALPRVVAETSTLFEKPGYDAVGSIWQLEPGARDLDANIIALPPNDEIGEHIGPDLDVLILMLKGSGELQTELNVILLQQGTLLWLPRKSQRRFIAGPQGLQYFTVHQRKPTLNITAAPKQPENP